MARLNGARLLMLEKEKDEVVRDIPVRSGQVQIGSNPTVNTIRLNSAGIEPIHCKIFVKNDKVFIANYSAANPISVDQTVVPKRAALHDGSVLEICGTRFRWKFDDSKLAATGRPEKSKKAEQTPTSSKFGNRRRTTMVRKKQLAAAAGGSGKKAAAKKVVQQKTPTYTLPKNHKQLLKNIRKRFTVHNIMTRHNSQDDADEDDADGEESASAEVAESPKPATPQKSSSTTSSAANTPFYTPEPEKENSVPVTKTPRTPMLQLENSAMMILSYTPAIGSRSKANIQKTPMSAAKSAQRLNYLTPKNENVSANATPLQSKAGNSMYLIDLTSPNSGHSSFVCSPMLDMTASSVGSPKLGLIDLTTPSPKNAKTPASVLKSTQQKTLLKSALKNASRTPRTALRTATGTPATPKAVPKISLNDTPTKSAVSTRSNKTPASVSKGSSIRSKLETPISSKKVESARKQTAPATPTVAQSESTPKKEVPIMTTDELFDTLVGRQSNVKTYERKSTSPKKTPCPLVVAEDTSELPKSDIDLWVESVVAAVTSPEPVNMDAIIRKPNQTTQVRSSQYSDITPHESFAETAGTSEVVDTQPEVVPVSSPDELDNMTDKPTIPISSRRSETPLASKIARSLGNKRQTIGNFFTNIFGKLTVSPVTRISIADDSLNQTEHQEPTNGDDSDGSEEEYHDSETNHAEDVAQPTEESVASSPKLRQSLRDTRKFIGNAWTSLNTSRPQLDNTAEIDESLLLSDTYNETQTDAGNNTVDEDYDLTDLGSRPTTAQPPVSAAKTPTLRRSVQSVGTFDISPLATPLENTPNKTVPPQDLERDAAGSFFISPEGTLLRTPVSRRSQASTPARKNVTEATPTTNDSTPSRRSTRRQTIPQADSNALLNESTVNSPALQAEEADKVEDIVQEQSCSETAPDQLEQSTCNSSNKSMNAEVVNEQDDEQAEVSQILPQDVTATSGSELVVNEQPSQSVPEDVIPETLNGVIPAEGELKTIDEEQPNAMAITANSTALDTSEMEPLEVTEGHESESEVVQPATSPSKDLIGSKRATRNSIATCKVVTPKSASPSAKVPLSESKLPLRGLRRKTEESPKMTSLREVDLLEDSNKSMDPIAEAGDESVVEQSTELDKSTTPCDDQSQAEVVNFEAELTEITTPNEVSLAEDHVTTAPESSQVSVNPSVESVEDVHDSPASIETSNLNIAARRSTRKSLATMTLTPKTTAGPLGKVPMSESKLPLRGLQKTMVEAGEKSPEMPSGEVSVREAELLNDSDNVKEGRSINPNLKFVDESIIEQSIAIDKSMIPCDDQADVSNAELNEITTHDEALQPEENHGTASLESSQTTVDPDLETGEVSAVHDSMTNLETSNLIVAARRSTRKSLATMTTTPKTTAGSLGKIPMSESKLPLRGLQKMMAKAGENSPEMQRGEDSTQEVDLPEDSDVGKKDKSIDPIVEAESNETIAHDEVPLSEDHVTSSLELSQTAVDTDLDTVQESAAHDSTANLETSNLSVVARRTTRKSLATTTTTPKTAGAPLNKVPMSESKLPLRQLRLTETSILEQTVEEAPTEEDPSLDENSIVVDSKQDSLTLEQSVELGMPQTCTTTPSANGIPIPSSPGRPSRSGVRSTPLKVSNTPSSKSTPSSTAPLLKRVLQKVVKAGATKAAVAQSPKPNDSAADASLQLDQLYRTPTPRVTRGKTTATSTPNVADVSLNLDELYKTPARATRGNATPAGKVNDDESLASSSLHLDHLYGTPVRSVVLPEDSKITLKDKLESSSIDKSLNLHELYTTPAKTLCDESQLSEVPETPKEDASAKVEADMSLNLQQMYKTPARVNAGQLVAKNAETPKETETSLNLEEIYKTPERSAISFEVASEPAVNFEPKETVDMSLNLQELHKTPAEVQKSPETNPGTPKVSDASLNLHQLYKTPARSTRHSAAVKSTPKPVVEAQPSADMSLNLQELYKTPARPTRSAALASTSKSIPKAVVVSDQSRVEESQPDETLYLQELLKTPASTLRANTQLSAVNNLETPKEDVAQADASLNLQQLYNTPARPTRSAALASTSKSTSKIADLNKAEDPQPDISLNLQELYKTPARPTRSVAASSTIKSTPKADQSKVEEPQPDVSLNLQELLKTPARTPGANPNQSTVNNLETPKEDVAQADASLNLQQLYKTPARPTRSAALASTSKSTSKTSDLNKAEDPQPDISLNLQELYKTPARPTRSVAASSTIKSTPKADQCKVEEPQPDVSLNLQELLKTPARTPRANLNQSTVNNLETPKEDVAQADASFNLQQLYKTPARPTRSAALASTSNSTPKTADLNKAEEPQADISLNLQERYKTPARTLRGVSQLTPASTAKISTPAVEPVQREPEADVSLNLDQMYKTPARQLRGTAQISAVKHVKVSEVTPQKAVAKSATDMTPTAEPSKVQRTPIASLSEPEANMTLNLEQMYKTPARPAKEIFVADATLNLDQLYKTPAHSLPGVTQLTSAQASITATEAKSEAEVSLNLQELYKTPVRSLRGDTTQASAVKESNQTPAPTQQNTTAQANDSNLKADSLFKTPARTTRARLPRSSAKATSDATPVAKTPSRTPRSASKSLASTSKTTPAANKSVRDPSMVESELASLDVVEDSLDMGSESVGLASGKAISSTPFNPRIRKSTLMATVGMMSPLNSSGDVTMTFTSEMHTEAIGITTVQDKSTASDSTTVDQMQTMAGVFVAAQSRLLYDETGSESTMLGDPLQVTNAIEPLADTQLEETTCAEEVTASNESAQPTAAEHLLEQNETLTKTPSSEKATVDVPESAEQSLVSTKTAAQDVEEFVTELSEADASLSLEKSNSSPARALRSSRSVSGTPVNKSAVDNTSVIKAVDSDVDTSLNRLETPARVPLSEKSTPLNTPAAVVESKSPAVQSPITSPTGSVSLVVEPKSPAVHSPVASLKVHSSPASSAKKLTSATPKSTPARLSIANISVESKPSSASKQRRSVAIDSSVIEQGHAAVLEEVDETANEPIVGSPAVASKSAENVPDVSVSVDLADDTNPDKSVTNSSVPESSAVEEKINDVTPEVISTTDESTVAAPYIDANNSLGVDTALLQQIRERVTTLELELEELDNVTHGSSTFLERSDDSQEVSGFEAKLEDKMTKPKKRQLYTKIAPDDSTPERRESIGDHRATSSMHVYLESASSEKKADTSSEADESKKVDQPVKVLPSRASRRKITTLSEEALAGASPELKFVKPKPPKVVPTEETLPINTSANTSETEASDQETSLGRRKVAFNDHVQVKEINSPAFIGEIIKKTSLRGRGRNTKQVVTVTVDQNLGQSIKPATKRGKPVDLEEVPAQDAENVPVETTEDVSDNIEAVEAEQKPSRAGKPKTTSKKKASATEPVTSNDEQVAEDAKEPDAQSEQAVEASVDKPAAKRSRAKKAPAAKRTASKTKVEQQTSTSEDKTDEPEAAAVKTVAKRSRRGAKTDAEVIEAVKEADADANMEVEQKIDEPVAAEEIVEDAKEPSDHSEEIVEASVEEVAVKRGRSKKAPAAKRATSRTKMEEQTAANEDKADEPETVVVKSTGKRLRRGANVDASDVNEAVAKEAEDEEKPAEVEQSIDEPISKRIRHAPETKTEQAVEKPVDGHEEQTKEPEQTDEVQPATKAPSRSRRGKKQATEAPAKTEDVQAESEAEPVKAQEAEQASKTKEVKPRSRRGRKKNDAPVEESVHTESTDDAPAEAQESTDSTTEPAEEKTDDIEPKSRRDTKKKQVEKNTAPAEDDGPVENATIEAQEPSQTDAIHEVSEPKEETKSRSRRGGAKGKTTDRKPPAAEVENTPAETKNAEDAKQPESRRAAKKKSAQEESESEELSSSADNHEEKSSSQNQPATKKINRRGRGAPKNDTVESGDHPESSTATSASLVVEKAVADSTSSDDPSTAEVDAKSNTKRSRRGAKDESESTEAKDEPTTKRTRRAPKSKTEQVSEEVPAETAGSVEVSEEPKAIGRSRRGHKQESVVVAETESSGTVVEKPATKRTKQTAKKVEVEVSLQESTVEQQEASKVEQSDIEEKPAPRRGAKKKAAEEQSNARMPSPTLPPPAVEEQPAKRVGRQAAKRAPKKASNPDPATVEMSMNESHMVKTVLPATHTSTPLTKTTANADVEVPSATRGRRAANPVIAALIEESTPSTRTRRGASATPKEQVETPSTPARRGRGRGAVAKAKTAEDETAKTDKEVEPEVVEAEPVAKRARKVPAKLRDEADNDLGAEKALPTRGRRGAKAKTEESNAADDETVEVSAGPSEEPKKKGRATAKRTVKKADLNEESVPEEEEKTPQSPPPKRTRKGAR